MVIDENELPRLDIAVTRVLPLPVLELPDIVLLRMMHCPVSACNAPSNLSPPPLPFAVLPDPWPEALETLRHAGLAERRDRLELEVEEARHGNRDRDGEPCCQTQAAVPQQLGDE
jgi:hypothetical protein